MKKILILLSLCVLILAACGGDSVEDTAPVAAPTEAVAPTEAALSAAATVSVEMHDMYFGAENNNVQNPPVWTVPAGAEVTLELNNMGALEHNWAIVNMGQEVPEPYTGGEDQPELFFWSADVVAAGTTETYTFTAPSEVGDYLVICTVAGHYPLMQGRLTVE